MNDTHHVDPFVERVLSKVPACSIFCPVKSSYEHTRRWTADRGCRLPFFKVLTHAGCSPAHPRAPGQCLHFECRGGPARVGCGDARGSPPLPSTLPHHLCVCVCVPWRNLLYLYLTSSDGVVGPELRICRASNKGAYTLAVVSHSGQRHNSLAQQRVR